MVQAFSLFPGVTLRCYRDDRFKQGCLSIQFIQPMNRQEAAKNALLPAVLLRGTKDYPDLRSITQKLDDLYGASVSALVRRVGDYQTTGLFSAFMEDRFALEGDQILAPMARFLKKLLLEPVLEDGGFSREYVEGEKRNLILTLEAERNDKRAYAASQLLRTMCSIDTFGIPRLGEKEQVAQIDHRNLYEHYKKLLSESIVELFYVGSARPEQVSALMKEIFGGLERALSGMLIQTPFRDGGGSHTRERMEVAQGKLSMGFTTPITNRSPQFAAMQVFNAVFGAGMTSKLFMNVRERLSLCYSIGSGYYSTKGILTVSAGIDTAKEETVRQEILAQLKNCAQGEISEAELNAAKEAILSGLRSVHDSPGAIEGYYSTAALSGLAMTPAKYMDAVKTVTVEQVADAAQTVKLHSSFFLEGVSQ